MPKDKSLFYYGWIYHKLFDPPLSEARERVVDLVPEGSTVLDIACGTGQLSFALRADKRCRVVGIDLSRRMLQFAENHKPYDDIIFMHRDAADLSGFGDRSFDYATLLFLMHELPPEKQFSVLREALRVAARLLIVDSAAPIPRTLQGFAIRAVEATFGHEHYSHFKNFQLHGGISGMLEESGLPVSLEHRTLFWHVCRELVVASGSQ